MSEIVKVKINEIQEITNLIFEKLKASRGNEIEISYDFYWDIPSDEIYNPYKEPSNLTLGQLSDEIMEIQNSIITKDLIYYDLKRISAILRALSIQLF